MKFFGNLFAMAGVVLVGITSAFALDPQVVIKGIQQVTVQSSNLQMTVSQINETNICQTGHKIVSGWRNITNTVIQFNALFVPNPTPYADETAAEVVDVLTTFVEVHQLLLETIIGKHSLAAQFFLTAPIATGLRAQQNAIDTFAFRLIGLIPTEMDAAQGQFVSLNVTFMQAIVTYSS